MQAGALWLLVLSLVNIGRVVSRRTKNLSMIHCSNPHTPPPVHKPKEKQKEQGTASFLLRAISLWTKVKWGATACGWRLVELLWFLNCLLQQVSGMSRLLSTSFACLTRDDAWCSEPSPIITFPGTLIRSRLCRLDSDACGESADLSLRFRKTAS